MTLEGKIAYAARLCFFIAAVSVVHAASLSMPPLWLATFIFGSGFSDIGDALIVTGHPLVGIPLEIFSAAMFGGLGLLIGLRQHWAIWMAAAFLTADGLEVFAHTAASGAAAAFPGLLMSLMLVFHAIVLWFMVQAILAAGQLATNARIARSLEVTAKLRRRLEENEEPAPPAASFSTRWRPMPPV
jgi:ABC-type multidrug transport system fused ATPase/permease subunit